MDVEKLKTGSEGLMLVGLPETTLIIVQALSRSTGKSYPDVIAVALQFLASKALNAEEQQNLAKRLKELAN